MLEFLKTLSAPKDTPSKGQKKKARYTRFKTNRDGTPLDDGAKHTRFKNARTRDRADVERARVTPQTVANPVTADASSKTTAPKPAVERVTDPIVEPIAKPSTKGVTTPTAAEAFFHRDPSPKRASAAATSEQTVSPDVLRRALPKRFADLDPDHPVG